MMLVYRFNDVFEHIEKTLFEHFGDLPEYDDKLFVLGYNVLGLHNIKDLQKRYPKYKIIIYQLEQLFPGSPWVNMQSYKVLKAAYEIWDYDEGNILWMRKNYNLNAKLQPLIYTESLKIIPTLVESECDIDILFYGYLHERRARYIIQLQHAFAGKSKIFDLYGVWGKDLDEYIRRSKIILNIRSKDFGRQEQPRIYYPVINGRCVLSEKSPINYFGDSIVEVPYDKMLDKTKELLKTGEWVDIAYQASDIYKKKSEEYIELRENIKI